MLWGSADTLAMAVKMIAAEVSFMLFLDLQDLLSIMMDLINIVRKHIRKLSEIIRCLRAYTKR